MFITQILFFDTEIYIKGNEFHNKIFRKKTDPKIFLNIKGSLSGLRPFLAAKNPFKMTKNDYYFT